MPRPRPTVGSTTGLTGTSGTSGGSPTISGGPVPAGSIIPASLKTTPTSPTGAGQVLGYDGTGFAWVAPGGSSAAVLTNRGVWAVSTSYAVGDVVVNGSTTYACTTSHTSGVTFSGTNWVALGSTAGGLASITITGTPSAGQVLQATSSTAATWVTPTSPQSTLGTIQTAASTPVTGRVNRYDASSGALSLTMPAVAAAGGSFSVQKTDSSTNTVTIGGVTLDKPKALVEFVSDGTVWAQVNASTGSPQTPAGGSGLGSVTVSGTPTAGQVLTASSGTAASWSTPASGAGDATTAAKGVVQLAGDLGGTASAPTVPGLAGKYTKPGPGIPATDLTAAVQSAVAAAGTAVQSVNGKTGTSVTLNASDVGAVASVVGQTGAVTGAQIAADPALTGTYAAASVPNLDTTPGADNTAAILAARAAAISRGVPLWLPPGTWKMSDILTGWNGGRVIAYGATLDIQTDHSSTGRGLFATAVDDFEIVGLTLAQSNATARNSVYGMLTFLSSSGTGCSNIRLRGVRVTGGESAVVYAENMTDFEIDGIAGSGTWADGLHLCRGTRRGVVRGARIRNVGDDGISLVAITSESGGAVTWPQMSDITIADFQVDTLPAVGAANASGVAVVGAKDVTVSGGTVKAAKLAGVNIQGGAGIGAPNPDNVTVTAVTVVGTTAGHGFLVGASTDVTLDGVAARGCSDAGVALLGSTRTHVAGSKFRGNGYGAYESAGTDNALSACDLRGNTIGPHQLATATLTGCVTA